MSDNFKCSKRIKPLLLRDIKTEALLVFIRTTLEESFSQIDENGYNFKMQTKEDNEFVYVSLKNLLLDLQETVVNSLYLRSLIANAQKNATLKVLAKKEEPLMVYYDSVVKAIEIKLQNGTKWIPELMVICLLSEWIIEEEKSLHLYPFLANTDYLKILNMYEEIKPISTEEEKEAIMNMYRISTHLITKLKNANYKVNNTRKKKRRK